MKSYPRLTGVTVLSEVVMINHVFLAVLFPTGFYDLRRGNYWPGLNIFDRSIKSKRTRENLKHVIFQQHVG